MVRRFNQKGLPRRQAGQLVVEILVAFGLASILLPALLTSFVSSTSGKAEESQRQESLGYLKEEEEIVRSVREASWNNFAVDGTYHPAISGSSWILSPGSEVVNGFTRSVTIGDAFRDGTGKLVDTGGTIDPGSKKITLTVSWGPLAANAVTTSYVLTRYLSDATWIQTLVADFNLGIKNSTQVTNVSGGEVQLANNNKAKWCSPALSSATIDLPDGPPVAVAAYANATSAAIPNNVFVATAPTDSTQYKLAFVNVTANSDPPVPSLVGTFTMDPSAYSNSNLVPTGTGLDNNFKTTDVKYYTSASGKIYALLGTDLPSKEVIAIQINNGSGNSFQDPTNKIYKYWTFFNTRQYQGDARSTPNQDQSPFGYGAETLMVFGNRGYITSGGYLYVFDLTNIDSKSSSSGLDMVGCRIQLDGYECLPNSNLDQKYNAGQTGTTWSDTTPPAHNTCSDGGNIELYADHELSAVTVGASTYVYVAVGAGTDPEFAIANVTSIPTNNTNPKINSSSCGRISGGASGWHEISNLDFNSKSGTEEAANSVYAKSDGTRAYVSSNGGIDANGDSKPDSDQFYIIDTTNKSSPKFLSGTSSTGAQSGFYNGDTNNIQLFPRRSLTVLNGERAILVGQDGFINDSIEPDEYQVLNIDPADPGGNRETTPIFCGGLNSGSQSVLGTGFDITKGFNDLTSVSEADGDNFVYMVANTLDKQLKIIQGGPDTGIYAAPGTFESGTLSLASAASFNSFTATVTNPTNTSLKIQVAGSASVSGSCNGAAFNYIGPDGTSNTYFTPSSGTITGSIPYTITGQCFRYKAYFDTTDFSQTPVLKDFTVNYSP